MAVHKFYMYYELNANSNEPGVASIISADKNLFRYKCICMIILVQTLCNFNIRTFISHYVVPFTFAAFSYAQTLLYLNENIREGKKLLN